MSEKPVQSDQKLAYTFDEGLRIVGLSRRTGYRAMAAGLIDTYKYGRRRYVTREALQAYIDRMQRDSGTGAAA